MQDITIEAKDPNGIEFNVTELEARFSQLTDRRAKRGKIYSLSMLLTMIILAKLAGEDKPSGIAQWIRFRCAEFVKVFNFKHERMPCLNTIRGVLDTIVTLEELERIFAQYLYDSYGGRQSQLIAIDGKTMRGTIPKGELQGVHLLSAYLAEEGLVLNQVAVETKENEISAAPELIERLDLKGKVVCGDAMHTQRQLSVDILAKGGDFIWFLKDNQPTLLADVEQFFKPPQKSAGWQLPEVLRTEAQTMNKGHGRVEKRSLTLMIDEEQFLDWPGVRQVFKLERFVKQVRTGQESTEVIFGITSCDPATTSAQRMLTWTRHYWAIENGLHYRRDVTLREDSTRTKQPVLGRTIATINNFVVGVSQKLGYTNLASARRLFAARISAQLAT